MARIRTIKPEFPQSESMGRISREARLCFILIWTLVDDEGRTRASSRMLASLLYPYDDDAPRLMEQWLAELERENCVICYSSQGKSYLQVCNWLNHQKIDKPSRSKFPPFDESSRIVAKSREESSEDQGSRIRGSEDQGEDQGPVSVPTEPHPAKAGMVESPEEKIYQSYPRKEGHGAAITSIEKAVKRISAGKTKTPREPMTKREAQMKLYRAVIAYARSPVGSQADKTKIPHPATWFNQERWEDDQQSWSQIQNHNGGTAHVSYAQQDRNASLALKLELLGELEAQDLASQPDRHGRTIEAGRADPGKNGAGEAPRTLLGTL